MFFVYFCVSCLMVNTVVVVCCLQIRENHRQKEKEMKNFAELVSRTSKHSTLKVRFHMSDFIGCQFNIQYNTIQIYMVPKVTCELEALHCSEPCYAL